MTDDQTATVDTGALTDAFEQALATDAERHADDAAAAVAPPRVPWLNDDGTPKYGFKADGVTPKRGPGGPGRGNKRSTAEKPRAAERPLADAKGTGVVHAAAAAAPSAPRDYTDEIAGGLTMLWMGTASIRWTKAHAAIIRAQTPALVPALNTAAQQNPTIRQGIEKLSGEGSWAWVIPLVVATTPLATGFWQVTRNSQLRAELAAQTDQEFAAFIMEQARAAGMTIPELTPPAEQTPEQVAEQAAEQLRQTADQLHDLAGVA